MRNFIGEVYTRLLKRTSPHPSMAAFDAPNREMCVVQRSATNTPIQALVTLNDPQFVEARTCFCGKILRGKQRSRGRTEDGRGVL